MEITKVVVNDKHGEYEVRLTYTPNWFERVFSKREEYEQICRGSGTVWFFFPSGVRVTGPKQSYLMEQVKRYQYEKELENEKNSIRKR